MEYYAKIEKEEDYFLVSFPDVPGAITDGDTLEEALANASEALNGCLESDFDREIELPEPKKYNGKQYHLILVDKHIEISHLIRKLRNEMHETQLQVANKLDTSYQNYQKLENPKKCNPNIKTLEKISAAFGKKLEISFV